MDNHVAAGERLFSPSPYDTENVAGREARPAPWSIVEARSFGAPTLVTIGTSVSLYW